jgi:SAM-dependent methyltransferase
MFATGTKILGNFFSETLSKYRGPEKLRILELGAGTGGTTKHMIDILLSRGIEFSYTFTDLSSSMVAAAKKKFAHYNCMEYMVLDVEKEPPKQLVHSHHIILSSNCVHATKSLVKSSINIHKILRNEGFLCLLELTRNLFWLDCVFGLLEGWWLFEDDRKHVLADEFLWKQTLMEAGFKHVDWSDDETEESDQFRVIAAFVGGSQNNTALNKATGRTVPSMETVEYHRVGGTSLYADIYYPTETGAAQTKRPIGMPFL